MPNVELAGKQKTSPFRKIALGTWQTTYDPSIYGTMRLRMDKAVDYIAKFREKHGKKLTVTHLVVKAIALALKECPDANGLLRWNRIYQRRDIDVSMLVLIMNDGKADLSSAKIASADQKSLVDIITEIEARAQKIRDRQDKELEKTRQSMKWIPFLFMNLFLRVISFLSYSLNLDLRWAGLPKDPFGSAMVTSIGSLGLELAYVPLVPYARVPILVAPGEITDEPVVVEGKLAVGKIMNLNATFDHRLVDGAHAAVLSRVVRKVLEDPFAHLDPV
jgi:pyruvate/2-oxoglutarate dehydrogenase complex dihydrolipoamide acyltransferase (E2) component